MNNSDTETLHVDKEDTRIIITWMGDSMSGLSDLPEDTISLFNQKLKEKGYDFKIKLVTTNYSDYFSNDGQKSRYDVPTLAKELDADIYNVGWSYYTDLHNYYLEYVQEGVFITLNQYLETSIGTKVKDSIPDKLWNTHRIDENIYSIPLYADYQLAYGFTFNMDLANKYNIAVPDTVTKLSDLENILEEFKQNCENTIIPLSIESIPLSSGYSFLCGSSTMILIDQQSEIPKVVKLMDQPYIMEHLKTLERLRNKGLIKQYAKNQNTLDPNIFETGKVFVRTSYPYPNKALQLEKDIKGIKAYNGATLTGNSNQNTSVFDIKYKIAAEAYIQPHYPSINGITAWSKHPEEAFRLLAALATDEELASILCYGIEGQDYQINEDGSVSYFKNRERAILVREILGNRIDSPVFNPIDGLNQIYNEVSESKLLTMPINYDEVLEELSLISELSEVYKYLWKGESQDIEADVAEFTLELEQAGIDKVIDNINSQIEVWWREHRNN
jgi:putative aldouronate transport system substrate-binding protein